MKRRCVLVSVCSLCWMGAGPAAAMTTIDFESLPDSPFYSYTEGRVTFTAVDGSLLQKFPDTLHPVSRAVPSEAVAYPAAESGVRVSSNLLSS